jgi:hypothetical protein
MFTCHAAVLSAAILPHIGTITVQAWWLCDCTTLYDPKYFIHQSATLPRKTPTQELKQKCVVLTLYWLSIWLFLKQPAHSIPHTCKIMGRLLFKVTLNLYLACKLEYIHSMDLWVIKTIWYKREAIRAQLVWQLGYELHDEWIRVWFLAGARDFSLLHIISSSLTTTNLPSTGYQGFFPGDNAVMVWSWPLTYF